MKHEPIYEEEYKGYHFEIIQDDDCSESPREWGNLGTIVTWHRRYTLGDEQPNQSATEWMAWMLIDNYEDKLPYHSSFLASDYDCEEWLLMDDERLMKYFNKYYVILPVYLYDHSGITISCRNTYPFNDLFDGGQVGFIYVDKQKALKEFNRKHWSKSLEDKVIKILKGEVKIYDDYLTGDVYGYAIWKEIEPDENEKVEYDMADSIDSLWGIYPDHNIQGRSYQRPINEAKSFIDWQVKEDNKKLWEQLHLQEQGE